MCEIFGASLEKEHCINDFLKIFFSHSVNHPHGWGLACMDSQEVSVEKEPLQASRSNYLKKRLSQPVSSKAVLAHIRYATIGNVDYCNCHPYSEKDNCGRRWTLIHNGTIFDYPPLNKFIKCQCGETDSERILLYIIQQLSSKQKLYNRPLNSEERFNLLDGIISDMSKDNKLNLLIYDGEYMYVHTNCKVTLHYLITDYGTIFSTLPLTDDNWQDVQFTTLLAYKDGNLVFSGTNHKNEYIENKESMKFLYQIFSDL